MKKQLYIYIALIALFVIYNVFFRVADTHLNTIINILFSSGLFLYLAYIAFVMLKKMKK
ncbi:hypothetical protein [Riemerella columbina]|uniref:hypothetical protein n=1 Tax=Riemerella columbina TaxID=103810 RepID=UPI000369BAA4|nr:hypothetical protein [Riemerella columbina]